jgi:hypothetical protein
VSLRLQLTATLIFSGLVFLPSAFATEIYENYISVRALGMGNAFSAIVDNKDSLFYNPAGLDRIHRLSLTVMDPTIGTDAVNAYSTYQSATGNDYAKLIQNFYGQEVYVGVEDTLALAVPDFAIAGFDAFQLNFNLNNPAYSNLTFSATNDVGIATGIAMSLLPSDLLRFGIVGKRITRYGGRVVLGPSTIATLSNTPLTQMIGNYGTGYGADAGILLELPVPAKPTFSAVWHDIGQTFFNLNASSSTPPPPILDEIVFGYGMEIDVPGITIRPAIDFKHATMGTEQIGKRLHTGVEIQLPILSLRAGLNQGYYTLGLGFDFKYFRLDAATYGVELDTYPGQLEDRRYIAQITIDFNFDLHFGDGKTNSNSVSPTYYRR